MTTVTLTTASVSPWTCPANVISVQVECWGGGGKGGGISASTGAAGGGGGGAYAKLNAFATIPGNTYAFVVGTGSTSAGAAGVASQWINTTTLNANGGFSVAPNAATGVPGGQAGTTGNVANTGGTGGTGSGTNAGGGGEAAGAAGAGNNAVGSVGGTGQPDGGDGGAGRTGTTGGGTVGSGPGGGGGGAMRTTSGTSLSGNGADGQIILTFTANAIAGTTALSFDGQGTLAGLGSLAGESDMALGATGLLSGVGSLSGEADLIIGITGALSQNVTPTAPAVVDAGARRRRTIYFVTIDGRRFECASLGEALELLRQAKELAQRYAAKKVSQNVTEPTPLKAPVIVVSSRELRAPALQIQREIANIYAEAFRDAEIRMFMALDQRKRDDDDAILLLM